jgi:hypothetical protein
MERNLIEEMEEMEEMKSGKGMYIGPPPEPSPTLRDQFAMAALNITLQNYWEEVNRGRPVDPDWREGNAMEAYRMADAMMEARK